MFISPAQTVEEKTKNDAKQNKPHENLIIEKIFMRGDEKTCVELKANHVAFLVSQKISLKNNQIGILSFKKKFDDIGLLAICSKTVHPGFIGRISAHVINIQGESIPLKDGDAFMELFVFENDERFGDFPSDLIQSDEECFKRVSDNSRKFPKVFLGISKIKDEIISDLNKSYGWGFVKKFCTVLAGLSVIFAGFNVWFSFKVFGYINDYSSVEQIEEIKQIKNRLETIEGKKNR